MRLLGWFFPQSDGPDIAPLSAKHYRFTGHDERLASVARARREIAERAKQRAALIASGSQSNTVLKMVKR